MKIIDKYNIDHSHIFEEFEKRFASTIDNIYSILSNINISIIDISHINDIIKGNPLLDIGFFKDTPYSSDTKGNYIVDNYDNFGLFLTQAEKYSLIAHEIGHIYLKLSNANPKGINEELEADKFACAIGLQVELKSALIKLESFVQNSVLKNEIGVRISKLP